MYIDIVLPQNFVHKKCLQMLLECREGTHILVSFIYMYTCNEFDTVQHSMNCQVFQQLSYSCQDVRVYVVKQKALLIIKVRTMCGFITT